MSSGNLLVSLCFANPNAGIQSNVFLLLLASINVFTGLFRVTIMVYITTFILKIHTMKMEEWLVPTILYLSDSQSYI